MALQLPAFICSSGPANNLPYSIFKIVRKITPRKTEIKSKRRKSCSNGLEETKNISWTKASSECVLIHRKAKNLHNKLVFFAGLTSWILLMLQECFPLCCGVVDVRGCGGGAYGMSVWKGEREKREQKLKRKIKREGQRASEQYFSCYRCYTLISMSSTPGYTSVRCALWTCQVHLRWNDNLRFLTILAEESLASAAIYFRTRVQLPSLSPPTSH